MNSSALATIFRVCEWITELLIYLGLLFGPWAFGTTQAWSIRVMNGVGFALGFLWLAKLALRLLGYRPVRWIQHSTSANPERLLRRERWFSAFLFAGTVFILGYCLVSAVNARAIYHANAWSFDYLRSVPWLPHSYDQKSTWEQFWKLLGLAGFFWALRDWLLTLSPREIQRVQEEGFLFQSASRLPLRLRRLFWLLALNGAALSMQGLIQRVEGGNKLLWAVVPRINTEPVSQFGPYAYRANAAQYLNLLWTAVLGFWWASVSTRRRSHTGKSRFAMLLPCVAIMAVGPAISASRGGFLILMASLVMSCVILWTAQKSGHWTLKAGILLVLTTIVGVGILLGWESLAPRMEMIHEGYDARQGLYLTGHYMARDNAVFGTGPGTFESMHQLYRRSNSDEALSYMHNDWLEAIITFGWVGAVPIFLSLILIFSHWFWSGGVDGNGYFAMFLWLSLAGCLVHACFDFPMQIHSVLALFLVIGCVLSTLSRRITP